MNNGQIGHFGDETHVPTVFPTEPVLKWSTTSLKTMQKGGAKSEGFFVALTRGNPGQ